ncbi:hypothetical protein [Aeromonas rivipollensis]|uniref:hypothetical protein n=1 Tax=Aeromonas rivipollensis TaxID=948519 RepID=UPI003D1CE0E4
MNETRAPNPKGSIRSSEQAREMQKKGAESRRRRIRLMHEIYVSEPDIGATMIDSILKGTPISGVTLDDATRQRLIVDMLKEYGPQLLAMRSKQIIDTKMKILEMELARREDSDSDGDNDSMPSMTTADLMAELGSHSDAISAKKADEASNRSSSSKGSVDSVLGSDDSDSSDDSVPEAPSFGEWFETLSASAQRKVTSKFEDADEMYNHWSADARTIRARYGLGANHGG